MMIINRTPLRGAGEEFTAVSLPFDRSTCRTVRCAKRKSIERKRRDRVHHALTQTQVKLFAARLKIGRGKMNWFADDNRNASKTKPILPDRPRFVRPENSHWNDRGQRLRDDEAHAGQRRLQIAVDGAAAFGKNQRPLTRFQDANQGLERNAIFPFLIDRDHIQLRQKPAEDGPFQKRFFREKKNRAVANAAHEGRIEITLVVRRQNHRPVIDHPLAMHDAQPEENSADQLNQMVAKPVVGIQSN